MAGQSGDPHRAVTAAPALPSLGTTASIGIAWLALQNVGTRIIGFVSQIILAKILLPSDYGTIALATGAIAIVSSFADFGLEEILVQRQQTMRLWRTAAFWMSLTIGLVLAVACIAASPFFAMLYGAPAVTGLIVIQALALPIRQLGTIPSAAINLALRFDIVARVAFLELLGLQVLTIAFATAGCGAYSFALPVPIIAAARTAYLWRLCPQTIGARPFVRRWRHIARRSIALVGSRILSTFSGQADLILLGIFATTTEAGLYVFAYRLAIQPVRVLAGSITGVMQSALSRLRNDVHGQTQAALRSSRLLAFIVMPTCFIPILIAEPAIALLFGERWSATGIVVKAQCIGLAFFSVSWISGALVQAQGAFGLDLILEIVFSGCLLLIIGLGVHLAPHARMDVNIAFAMLTYYVLVQPLYAYVILRRGGATLRQVAVIHLVPALYASAAVGLAAWLTSHPVFDAHELLDILVASSIALTIYVALLRLFSRDVFGDLVARSRPLIRKVDGLRLALGSP